MVFNNILRFASFLSWRTVQNSEDDLYISIVGLMSLGIAISPNSSNQTLISPHNHQYTISCSRVAAYNTRQTCSPGLLRIGLSTTNRSAVHDNFWHVRLCVVLLVLYHAVWSSDVCPCCMYRFPSETPYCRIPMFLHDSESYRCSCWRMFRTRPSQRFYSTQSPALGSPISSRCEPSCHWRFCSWWSWTHSNLDGGVSIFLSHDLLDSQSFQFLVEERVKRFHIIPGEATVLSRCVNRDLQSKMNKMWNGLRYFMDLSSNCRGCSSLYRLELLLYSWKGSLLKCLDSSHHSQDRLVLMFFPLDCNPVRFVP